MTIEEHERNKQLSDQHKINVSTVIKNAIFL